MPFWSSGVMYIPSSIFTGEVRKDLDVGYVYNPSRQLLILYNSAKQRLEFDMSRNYVGDSEGNIYYRRALLRGGEVFVPAALVAEYFGLTYSTTALSVNVSGEDEGWMVWLRDEEWTLSEKIFSDAASSMMRDRYAAYSRGHQDSARPDAPQDEELQLSGKQLYLCFQADTAANTAALLDELGRAEGQAAFYCTADFLRSEGDLLRRMAATGQTIGLVADGADQELTLLEQLSQGNEALYRATCGKTRMVYLRNADEHMMRTVTEAGYCCLKPQLDHSEYGLQGGSGAAVLQQRTASLQGNVSVWLGDNAAAAGVRTFLSDVGAAGNHCLSLTETVV